MKDDVVPVTVKGAVVGVKQTPKHPKVSHLIKGVNKNPKHHKVINSIKGDKLNP